MPPFNLQPPGPPKVYVSIAGTVDLSKRQHRTYSSKETIRVVGLHFGSTEDFRYVRRTISQVAHQLRMPWSTVQRIIRKFVAGGHSLDLLVAKKPRHFNCIPPLVKKLLLSQDLLQTWSPYSIKERTQLLRTQMNCKISADSLWQFYLKSGIRFRTGTAVYR